MQKQKLKCETYFVAILAQKFLAQKLRHDTQPNGIQHNDIKHTDTQHKILCHYAECHYAECHVLFTIMLNVIMLAVIMLSVFMLSVIMLSVVAPPPKMRQNYGEFIITIKGIAVTQNLIRKTTDSLVNSETFCNVKNFQMNICQKGF